MVTCPNCSSKVSEVYPIDPALREHIRKLNPNLDLNSELCRTCLNDLRRKTLGSSGILMAQDRATEDRKKRLWQSRVPLIKRGHVLMANRLYSEAAISYEKYLKVLELVFGCKPGQLTPESLKESARTAELTIIVGAYWDLMRIYDSNDKYTDRQKHASSQLAKFINYTPIYPDIMKKAAVFATQAKHPDIIKTFMSNAKKKRTRCFVATSAFNNPVSFEVQILRSYRDRVLKQNFFGRKFILIYYKISPGIAHFLDHQTWLKPAVRVLLRFVIKCVS